MEHRRAMCRGGFGDSCGVPRWPVRAKSPQIRFDQSVPLLHPINRTRDTNPDLRRRPAAHARGRRCNCSGIWRDKLGHRGRACTTSDSSFLLRMRYDDAGPRRRAASTIPFAHVAVERREDAHRHAQRKHNYRLSRFTRNHARSREESGHGDSNASGDASRAAGEPADARSATASGDAGA